MLLAATLHTGDPGRTGAHLIPYHVSTVSVTLAAIEPGCIRVRIAADFDDLPISPRPTHIGLWRGPLFIGGGLLDGVTNSSLTRATLRTEPPTTHVSLVASATVEFFFDAWTRDVPPT